MRKSIIILIVASIVTIAALASVSFGLSHVQVMKETTSFSGMADHHMSQGNSTECDDNISSHMNMTKHMDGNTYSGHEDMHNQLNMTEHMQDMHEEGNMNAPHMENNHGGCHD